MISMATPAMQPMTIAAMILPSNPPLDVVVLLPPADVTVTPEQIKSSIVQNNAALTDG